MGTRNDTVGAVGRGSRVRRPLSNDQSGQIVAIAAMALLVLGATLLVSLQYVGSKVSLPRQQAVAKQTSDVVRKALVKFVAKNYRLPCPASPTGGGIEAPVGGGTCTYPTAALNGVVPWKTLELQQTDALDGWGNQIGYAVSPGSTKTTKPYQNSASWSQPVDWIRVAQCGSGTTCSGSASAEAYVLISYGADGRGGYNAAGIQIKPLPANGDNQYKNTQFGAFAGALGQNFQAWAGSSIHTSAPDTYFDDWLIFETGIQICKELNGGLYGKSTAPYCTATVGPGTASTNSSNSLVAANPNGGFTNTYGCTSGSTYCPGSSNAGSAANTTSFVGSGNGTTYKPAGGGSTAALVGDVGFVSVGGAGSQGIYVGNSAGQANGGGDWVGDDSGTGCPNPYAGNNPNYMPPGHTLTYQFTSSYPAFTFVDFLPDGGTQLQVDGYAAPVVAFTGNITSGKTTVTGISTASTTQTGACGLSTASASPASLLSQGQNISAGSEISSGTTITGVVGTQLTLTYAPTVASATEYLVAAKSGTTINNTCTGDISASSNPTLITNVSCSTWPSVGQYVAAGGKSAALPTNTLVSAVSQTNATITLSAAATTSQPGSPIYITPSSAPMVGFVGTVTTGSQSVTNVASIAGLSSGQAVAGPYSGFLTTIASAPSGSTVPLSLAAANVDATDTGTTLVAMGARSDFTATVTSGSTAVTAVTSMANLTAVTPSTLDGQTITGPGIRAGTTIVSASGSSPSGTLTLSQPATHSFTGAAYFAVPWTRVGTLILSNAHVSNVNYGISFTGNVSNGSTSVSDVSSVAGLAVGAPIAGQGIRPGTTIAGVQGGTITMSQSTTFAGPGSETVSILVVDSSCNTVTTFSGTLSVGSSVITNISSVVGLAAGQALVATDIPFTAPASGQLCATTPATTISSVSGGTLTLSLPAAVSVSNPGADASANEWAQTLFAASGNFSPPSVTGTVAQNPTTAATVSSLSSTAGLAVGQPIAGAGIPAATVIAAVSPSTAQLTLSQKANVSATSVPLFVTPRPAVTTLTGTVTANSSTVAVSSTTGLAAGQFISGAGIQSATTISAVGSNSITLSTAADALAGTATQPEPLWASSDTFTVTGNVTNGSTTVGNVSSTTGFLQGQSIIGSGIPSGATVSAIPSASQLTISSAATATANNEDLYQPDSGTPVTGITGDLGCGTSSPTVIANVSPTPATTGLAAGEAVASAEILAGTSITAVSSSPSQITMSQQPVQTQTGAPLEITALPRLNALTLTGTTNSGTAKITGLPLSGLPAVGQAVSGPGIPAGTMITAVDGTPAITMSQNATASGSVTLSGGFSGCSSTTGTLTNGSPLITGLSCIAGLAAGQSISATGIPAGTTITAITAGGATLSANATAVSGTITLSANATSSSSNDTLSGSFSGCGPTTPTGTLTKGSTQITNVSCIAGLAPGQTIKDSSGAIPSGTTIQSVGLGTTALSGGFTSSFFTTYPSCPGPTADYTATNGGSGSASYSGWMTGGLYRVPTAYPTVATAPTTQHPSAAAANIAGTAQIRSQIWPQPGETNTGFSTTSRDLTTEGNYLGLRDNQFDNRQFIDSKGNVLNFNILSFQIVPYIYNSDGSIYQYCMLFEGMKGCYRDIYTASCTFQGNNEWGNPPVSVTANCNQHPW
jgi:hypothetical protein